jgi:hypothetical protein
MFIFENWKIPVNQTLYRPCTESRKGLKFTTVRVIGTISFEQEKKNQNFVIVLLTGLLDQRFWKLISVQGYFIPKL